MKKKKVAVVVLAVAIITVTTATFFLYSDAEGNTIADLIANKGMPKYNYTKGATLIPGEYRKPIYNNITDDYRPMYSGMSEEQYDIFFGNLPKFPKDFFSITDLIYDGRIVDFGRIDEAYWKQPEFYSSWFRSVNSSYINNNPRTWMPEGYGIFPLIKEISVTQESKVNIECYLRTAFGTEAYQGLILSPYFPKHGTSLIGDKLFENPTDMENYISCRITNPDNDTYLSFKDDLTDNNVEEKDWFFILKPTYQLIVEKDGKVREQGFPNDWARLMNIEITVEKSAPKGMYCIAVRPKTPCFEINQEFYFSQEHTYYGSLYYPSGGALTRTTPMFQIMMEVR